MTHSSKVAAALTLALDLHGVAQAIGIGFRTAQGWRARHILPEPDLAVGRVLRWRVSTIENWLANHKGAVNE